jgi:NADPH-dependent 2,4-dienoyl-CoA reductase/sulfur reductase-like enzyme/nitrite reductase/ring-hydroxylating ferredoxin subunit
MSGETNLSGPDLKQGVAESELGEGGMLVGHADGESVLVARVGGELFAVGASCTHYGGPLGDGLLDGQTVRCPWHHACFNLRTGEAERAPALNALPCYDVARKDGRLLVVGKRPADATRPGGNVPSHAPVTGRQTPSSVVIVGAGAAGHAAAEMLRREGYAGGVTLVGADPELPVDRPNLSKDYLAGTAPEEWIPLRPPEFFAEQRIEVRSGARVASLDTAGRRLALEAGDVLEYEALLLATGADPVRLALPGAELAHVFTLRSLADSRAVIACAASARRAVVVGASFIALEVAAALRTRNVEVDVAAPEAVPLERVMGRVLGEVVQGIHAEHGVRFHLGDRPKAISASAVVLESGVELDADLVVVGVGVRPAVELAERAGLAVDRGIVVSAELETSVPGVYAAGDVARYPDPRTGERIRVEHWVVAQRQGQTAAKNILGQHVRFASAPFFWSQHYDAPINYVGHAESWERADVAGAPATRELAVAYRRGPHTLAVATLARDRLSLEAEAALERGDEAALQKLVPPARA